MNLDSELMDAGMACMDVLFEQVASEMLHGNQNNIPDSILRLFALSVPPRVAQIRRAGNIASPALIECFGRAMRMLRKDPAQAKVCDHVDAMVLAFDLGMTVH